MDNLTLDNHGSESIDAFFKDAIEENFERDEVIVHGDQTPHGVYLIKKGFVKVYSVSAIGQHNLLLIHGTNELFPLPWALDGPQKEGIYYESLADLVVLRTSKNNLRAAMGTNHWLTEQVLRQLLSVFTIYAERIQSLGYRSARERVISCLLDLSARFGRKEGEQTVIEVPITHKDIADLINTTREHASITLGALFNEGLIIQTDHQFIIKDEEKLLAELS